MYIYTFICVYMYTHREKERINFFSNIVNSFLVGPKEQKSVQEGFERIVT